MVKLKEHNYIREDGTLDTESWLHSFRVDKYNADTGEQSKLRHAVLLAQLSGSDNQTALGISSLQMGIWMAEALSDISIDEESLAAAVICPSVFFGGLDIEDVREDLGKTVASLVHGVRRMDLIGSNMIHAKDAIHIENVRKMLLAMVQDVRVVLIKLAERVLMIRHVKILPVTEQKMVAENTLQLYAPLANRLGLSRIKWELEDLSFRYLYPDDYKSIAKSLNSRRIDRENYVQAIIQQLKDVLHAETFDQLEISGRAKHIYSIHRKMQRKHVSYDKIYDVIAVRVLVATIEECYRVLSIAHDLFEQIPEEFDDYIDHPKPNGYRSIHTAVIGPNKQFVEIQIRTHDMHKESELGVAAHWVYKEGRSKESNYQAKIAWLREVLAWQQELSVDEKQEIRLDDRVYVFTPKGEIIDLSQGATVLDFAYHVHSEVGHKCRGAKVNSNMVPLSYVLQTGDQIEVLTGKKPQPSRDWLNPHLGYLKTTRARAKVHHYFKLFDFDKNAKAGEDTWTQELKRLNISVSDAQMKTAIEKLNYKRLEDLFAALGCGDIKLSQILHAAELDTPNKTVPTLPKIHVTTNQSTKKLSVVGIGGLATHFAKCCKPVPGEPIIGFVTLGRGVSIHKNDCTSILRLSTDQQSRLLEVDWGTATEMYPANIIIEAYDRRGLVRDITAMLAQEKINLSALHTITNKDTNTAEIKLTLEIHHLDQLHEILVKLRSLSNVFTVKRI